MKTIIKNGIVMDPSQKLEKKLEILIENEFIVSLSEKINDKVDQIIDAKGLTVSPGFVDLHVHFREPGYEYKETLRTGSLAAAAGGFTSVCCMPNTNPTNHNRLVTEYILRKAKTDAVVKIYPIGSISMNLEGKELSNIGGLHSSGIVALSDDGKTVMNSYLLRKAMDYSKMFGLTVMSHCEDENLVGRGVMNEGFNSCKFGLRGIPKAAEEIIVARDIALASHTGAKLHILHVSTKGSVELVREAKRKGIDVTAEACPHHFTLTDDAIESYDGNFKMAPPLRTKEDIEEIIKGLMDGTIDCISTDHAPHSVEEKEIEFEFAANGIVGLETAFGLSMQLVHKKQLTLSCLVEKMSSMPAKIVNIPAGTLKPGVKADITLFDSNREWVVDKYKFKSKGRNTPFHGWKLKGQVIKTLVDGKCVYES